MVKLFLLCIITGILNGASADYDTNYVNTESEDVSSSSSSSSFAFSSSSSEVDQTKSFSNEVTGGNTAAGSTSSNYESSNANTQSEVISSSSSSSSSAFSSSSSEFDQTSNSGSEVTTVLGPASQNQLENNNAEIQNYETKSESTSSEVVSSSSSSSSSYESTNISSEVQNTSNSENTGQTTTTTTTGSAPGEDTTGNKKNMTCGDNEVMNNCPIASCEYCPTCDKEARACLSASQKMCSPPKCTCRNNYKRLQNGTCVPTRECPAFPCPRANEQFDPCPVCPSDNCTRATPDGSCPVIGKIGIPLQCRPSCRCLKNYWRDGDRCVSYDKCPNIISTVKCPRPNQSLQCIRSCPPLATCENRNKIYHCPFFNSSTPCTYECACNKGLYKNSDGICVTANLCDKKCTDPNEEYKPDKKTCPSDLCSSIVSKFACDPKEQGQPGCVCKPGFLRQTLNSTCIPAQQCSEAGNPPGNQNCTLPNESLQCVKSCPRPRTCISRHIRYKCFNVTDEVCENKCVCNDGLYRNLNGYCVTSDLCDKKCPGPNEVYTSDKKTCPPEICKSIVSRYACNPKEQGQPGCICKPGYLRLTLNSTCIPMNQCPELSNSPDYQNCTRPNESLKCVKSCPRPSTCAGRHFRYKCPDTSTEVCKNQCVCNDGLYRNSDGCCVTSDLCDKKCTGPNEVYKADKKNCPPQTCQSKFALYRCDPDEIAQPGCVCKPGYLRLNINSTCIPSEQCGQTNPTEGQNKTCGENEILNTCPSKSCEYCPTCDKEARACSSATQDSCPPPKCTCRNNYKRLQNGTCVPTRDCPPFRCPGPHEQFESCPLCASDDCSGATPDGGCPVRGRIGIPLQCRPSCRCKKNYWRDGDRCVPYEKCPNIRSHLFHRNDNTYGRKFLDYRHSRCRKIPHCLIRFADKKCTGPNELYEPRKKSCPPETCNSLRAQYKCDSREEGQPGCVCKEGFLRKNLNSTCIPKAECPNYDDLPNPGGECCNCEIFKPDEVINLYNTDLELWVVLNVP